MVADGQSTDPWAPMEPWSPTGAGWWVIDAACDLIDGPHDSIDVALDQLIKLPAGAGVLEVD